jgi:drug/metabolite transporter (DMT)-like permease
VLTYLLLAIIAVCTAVGDVLTAVGMKRGAAVEDLSLRGYARLALAAVHNGYVLGGVLALAIAFFALLAVLSIASVSFVVPATAATYLVETALAKYILNEEISGRRWAGAAMVAVGVFLLSV